MRIVALMLLLGTFSAPGQGLVVVMPATDGERLCSLTGNGTSLVHGLAADDATTAAVTRAIQAKGLYGIAAVARPVVLASLPYADNLVNVAYVDLDALAGKGPPPSLEEIRRVLAPNGVAYVKQAGQITQITRPRPAGYDDWTHFDYNAAGTGVSHDKAVAPPTNLQWWSEAQEYIGLGGNPAAYRPYTGFRIENGRAFALYGTGTNRGDAKNAPAMLIARDAFNGVPLWKAPGYSSGNGTPQEYQFVVGGGRVFTYLSADGPLTALDAATGKPVIAYEKAARLPGRGSKLSPGYIMFRYADGRLVQTAENRLIVLDAKTGDVKWRHEEKEDFVCFPRVIEAERKVLVQAVESGADKIQGRWANLKTTALLCFDFDSGTLLWRADGVKGMNFGQSVWAGDKVYLFCPGGIGASEKWGKNNPGGDVACVSAADGKLLWTTPQKFVWGYNLIVRDGQPYFATPDTLNAVSPVDGTISPFWRAPYNNRCNRTSATEDWVIMGLGIFVNRDGVADVKSISRSGCAQGAFPANGLTYFTPNVCTCFTMLRGHLALSAEAPRAAVADGLRIATSGGVAATGYEGKATGLETPISSEWLVQINRGATETPPVVRDGRSYVSVTHEHRLECRDAAGTVTWSFTAAGRISQPPVVEGDKVLFGAHDGRAYCVDAGSGRLMWSFLAAPYERNIVSHGQVESVYPVYNVVMYGGNACFTAGLHPEIGGGIHAWGVEPATGKAVWHKVFKRSELIAKPGTKIAPNRVLNSPLVVEDGKLAITGLTFTPDEDDAVIQRRIDTASVGDKLRNLGWTIRGTPVEKR